MLLSKTVRHNVPSIVPLSNATENFPGLGIIINNLDLRSNSILKLRFTPLNLKGKYVRKNRISRKKHMAVVCVIGK